MRIAVLMCIAVLAAAADANNATFTLAPAPGASLNLYVDKTGFLSGKRHHFTFDRFNGRATDGHVDFRIEANSIVCRDTWVSEKDRGKILRTALNEMLAASTYPVIRFESSSVRTSGDGGYSVEGMLTIRAVTRPAKLTVRRTSADVYSGEARIRLTDFGLKPPSAALGLVGTKDEMLFTFTLTAGRP